MDRPLDDMVLALWNRFHGKYRGVVEDNEDPLQIGRIKVKVPAVLGPELTSGWALPCSPFAGAGFGAFLLPEVGDSVWVEFEGGDPSYPVWTGCFWAEGEAPPEGSEGQPQVRVLRTVQGHKLVFDDAEPSLTIEDAEGNQMVLNADGIATTDKHGNGVVMDSSGIAATDKSGNELVMDSSGIAVKDATGNEVKLTASGVEIKAASLVKIEGQAGVHVGGSSAPAVLGTDLFTFLATHTHIGNMGAPTSPAVSPPSASMLSSKVMLA